MFAWLQNRWCALRGSYWLIPTLLVGSAFVAAQCTVALDDYWADSDALHWAYPGSPEGARAIIATIAAAVINLVGVTFSISVVALTMASAQLGPRLLRMFLRDRANQVVLGFLLGTFVFALLALRSISQATGQATSLTVSVTFVLGVASLGFLIFFIHNTTSALQADQVVAAVAKD